MATELQLSCPSPHPAALAVPCGGNEKFESNSVVLNENECFLPTAVAMASSYPWGTWEDLLLASAVLRHGIDNWSKVSLELQARAYLVPASLFSAEACEVRFWILNSRFSSCSDNTVRDGKIPWFEEVRKLRIAQLKRELEHHDGAIGLLQKKLNCLKAENTRPGELEIRHSEKQDSQNSLALEKASSCSSACSTSHGIYTHINLGTASMTQLEIESGQISCSLASSVTEIGEIQGTISKSDMDELKDENPNQVKSTDCLLVNQPFENTDHNMHSCGTNQHLSICVNTKMRHGPPFGEIEEKPLEPQGHLHASQEDGMCFQIVEGAHHNNSAETDDVSYKVDIPKSACPNTAKDTCFGDASHLGGVEGANDFKIRALDDHTCGSVETCPASELLGVNKETHSNDSCFKDEITCIANCHSSVKGCANLATCQGKETKIAVSKACFTENLNVTSASFQDAFLNASAIDLLRIAYTDGTPVSTPEFETQPVDLERLEEPEGYHDVVSMCSPLLEELSDRQCKDVNNRGMGQHEVCADNAILNQAQERMDPVAFSAEVPKSALSLEAQELDNQSKSCTLNGRKSVSPEVSEGMNFGLEASMKEASAGQVENKGRSKVKIGDKSVVHRKQNTTNLLTHQEPYLTDRGLEPMKRIRSEGHECPKSPRRESSMNVMKYRLNMDGVEAQVATFAADNKEKMGREVLHSCETNPCQSVQHINADLRTNNGQKKVRGSEQVLPFVQSSSIPRVKRKRGVGVDTFEDDGLLVDLMKLRDSDITTLRKRKPAMVGTNNADKHKGFNQPKGCPHEIPARKCFNLLPEEGNEMEIRTRPNNDQTKGHRDGPNQRYEVAVLGHVDKEVSEAEVSGILPPSSSLRIIAEKGSLPDLIIPSECLNRIRDHRFAPLFQLRPDIQNDSRYKRLIRKYMDLDIVQNKLEEGEYSGGLEVFRDMMLIFSNALVFYSRDSQEYGAAYMLREDLIKGMRQFLREDSTWKCSSAACAVKCSESKFIKDSNVIHSVTSNNGKGLASGESSSHSTVCENGSLDEDGAYESISSSRIDAELFESGKGHCINDLNLQKKDKKDFLSCKSFSRRAARTKTVRSEADRTNINKSVKAKHSPLGDEIDGLHSEKESFMSSPTLRSSNKCASRTDSSDKCRDFNDSSDRSSLLLDERRANLRKNFGRSRTPRSALWSIEKNPHGIQSYCQSQKKRVRT